MTSKFIYLFVYTPWGWRPVQLGNKTRIKAGRANESTGVGAYFTKKAEQMEDEPANRRGGPRLQCLRMNVHVQEHFVVKGVFGTVKFCDFPFYSFGMSECLLKLETLLGLWTTAI